MTDSTVWRTPHLCPVRSKNAPLASPCIIRTAEIECGQFWRHAQGERWLIGLGKTPTDAYDDLISQVYAHLHLDRATLGTETA